MADEAHCAFNVGRGYGRQPCPNPPVWIYVNGAYRRLECDEHAQQTRRFIRHPCEVWLEPRAAVVQDGGQEEL